MLEKARQQGKKPINNKTYNSADLFKKKKKTEKLKKKKNA